MPISGYEHVEFFRIDVDCELALIVGARLAGEVVNFVARAADAHDDRRRWTSTGTNDAAGHMDEPKHCLLQSILARLGVVEAAVLLVVPIASCPEVNHSVIVERDKGELSHSPAVRQTSEVRVAKKVQV